MMIRSLPLLFITVIIFHPRTSIAESTGKVIVFQCFSCHNKTLQGLNLSQSQLEKKLLTFKYSKNTHIMSRISKGFTDRELGLVAHYMSGSNQ